MASTTLSNPGSRKSQRDQIRRNDRRDLAPVAWSKKRAPPRREGLELRIGSSPIVRVRARAEAAVAEAAVVAAAPGTSHSLLPPIHPDTFVLPAEQEAGLLGAEEPDVRHRRAWPEGL